MLPLLLSRKTSRISRTSFSVCYQEQTIPTPRAGRLSFARLLSVSPGSDSLNSRSLSRSCFRTFHSTADHLPTFGSLPLAPLASPPPFNRTPTESAFLSEDSQGGRAVFSCRKARP